MQTQVTLQDGFFYRFAELVKKEVLPYQWEAINDRIPGAEKSGCIHNFLVAAGEADGPFYGMVFQDSDLAKWLEAAAYSLSMYPDPELEAKMDWCIDLLAKAQGEDGYLNTYFTLQQPKNRWKCIRDCHELYCAGHFLEAAVAYYRVTGKDRLLGILRRYMDYIAEVFGKGAGQIPGYPGHEEIELALCKLYDVTGERKYLDLAGYFIDERGQEPNFFEGERLTRGDTFHWDGNDHYGLPYFQAHKPVREQKDAVGHAVRAVYLYSGMADVAMRTDDNALKESCRALADSIMQRRMYVTGAIGSTFHGEAFTSDYDLPNDTVYGETCASVGLIFFMKRMLDMEHDAKYADVMERALYNTVLAGMALDGKSFFYVNPLEVYPEENRLDPLRQHVKSRRQKWFACACCPPNVARLLSDLGEYVYQCEESTVTVNLFADSVLQADAFSVRQTSQVPYGGRVSLQVRCKDKMPLTLRIRRPFWAGDVECSLPYTEEKGYLVISKVFADGETVSLQLDMPVRRVYANAMVREDIGKTAVMRGPLVYCLEEVDNGPHLSRISLREDAPFTCKPGTGVLDGMTLLTAPAGRLVQENPSLYCYERSRRTEEFEATFIPYYAWANRAEGEMTVWVREP